MDYKELNDRHNRFIFAYNAKRQAIKIIQQRERLGRLVQIVELLKKDTSKKTGTIDTINNNRITRVPLEVSVRELMSKTNIHGVETIRYYIREIQSVIGVSYIFPDLASVSTYKNWSYKVNKK